MAIHVHLASLLLLAAVPLFAQTNPAPAPSATAAHVPQIRRQCQSNRRRQSFRPTKVTVGCWLGTSRLFSRLTPSVPARTHWWSGQRRCHRETKFRPTSICTKMKSFVHKGTVRVTLAGREYDAGTGATVFIPQGNWIGVANVSSEPAMILFFFNKPAFEQCLRAISSRPGETFTMRVPEKMAAVRTECHEVMKQ